MKYYKFHSHDSGKVLYNLFFKSQIKYRLLFLKICNMKNYDSDDNSKIKYMLL